jgi:hypothetical protein
MSGEASEAAPDFSLVVETVPAGAQVHVNGEDEGHSPVVVGVGCSTGAMLRILADAPGYEPGRHTTLCRQDRLVKVLIRLRRRLGP